jgi:hypothetical protein
MKTKVLLIISFFISILSYSQTEIYFKYDEAGNQRYRGTNINARQVQDKQQEQVVVTTAKSEEEKFWAELNLYPVPVKDMLTIQWTESVNDLIDSVSLYQYSVSNWNFQQKNSITLNRQVQINMTGYYLGVYVLSFTLKDGRVYTKNIIKE